MAFPEVGVLAVVENVNGFLQDMGKMDNAVTGMADRANKAGGVIGNVGSKIAGVGKAAATMAVAGIAAAGVAVAGLGVASLKMAIDWESAFAGVRKTVNTTNEELEQTEQGLRDMAKVTPVAAEDLAAIAELGGQLGVVNDQTEDVSGTLLDFTEVIAAMGVSTNLTTEDAAVGFAQMSNVMGTAERIGSEAFSRLGSTIVALGNSSATTEADILNFAQRLAGAGSVAGVTEADVLGISAAFTSVGIGAQAGGTAVSKVFLNMNKAAIEGGEQMEIFAAVAGMEADNFGAAWEEDAGAVFGEFVKGLGAAGDDATAILDELGIKDSQAVRAFLSLAGAGDLVTDSINTANEGWDANSALTNEAAQRYATTESQMVMLKNTLKDVGITIGMALLPFLNKLLQAATPLINQLGKALPGFLNGFLIPAMEKVGRVMSGVIDVIVGLIKGTVGVDSPFEDFFPPGIAKIAEKIVRAIVPIIDTLKIEIPKAVSAAKKFITGSLIPAFQQIGQFILTQVVPAVMAFISAVVSFVQQHGPAIRNAILAIGAVLAAAAIVVQIMGVVAAIAALFNPVTLIIAAVALLAAAWTENWFGIQEIVASVIAFLLPIFQALVDFVVNTLMPAFISFGEFLIATLTPIVQAFATFIVAAFTAIRDWVVANWPAIQEAILSVLTTIQGAVQMALGAIRAFWEENGAAIMSAVQTIWDTIKAIIEAAIDVVQGIIAAAMSAIGGDWDAAWTIIKDTAETAWGLIRDAVDTALAFIRDTIFPAALSAIQDIWSTTWDAIKTKASEIAEDIKTKISAVMDDIRTKIETTWENIKVATFTKWGAIKTIVGDKIQAVLGTITSIVDKFKAAGAAVVDAIKQGIEDAWSGLVDGLKSKLNDLKDLLPFSEPKDSTSPLHGLSKAGAAIVGNIAAGLVDAMPVLQAQLNAAINPVQQGPVTTIGGNVSNVSNVTQIDVTSNPASQPSEQAIFFDVQAALAAART